MTTMSDQLLPCPFCGSDKLLIHDIPSGDGSVIFYHMLHFPETSCGVSHSHTDRDTLIQQWNTRFKALSTGKDGVICPHCDEYVDLKQPAPVSVDAIINAVRDEIIKEYGSMSIQIDEPNISGYFITGIIKSSLQTLFSKK